MYATHPPLLSASLQVATGLSLPSGTDSPVKSQAAGKANMLQRQLMSLLRPTTHIDPARINLILQLISAADDTLVHNFLGSLTAATFIGKSAAWCQALRFNRSHVHASEPVVKGYTPMNSMSSRMQDGPFIFCWPFRLLRRRLKHTTSGCGSVCEVVRQIRRLAQYLVAIYTPVKRCYPGIHPSNLRV